MPATYIIYLLLKGMSPHIRYYNSFRNVNIIRTRGRELTIVRARTCLYKCIK